MAASLILYPHQLYSVGLLPKVSRVYLVEEPLLFGTDKKFPMEFHKQKLALHRATMRRYADEVLIPNGFDVQYLESSDELVTETAIVKAAFEGATEIVVFDPTDDYLWERIEKAAGELEVKVPLTRLESPNFYLTRKDIASYFGSKKTFKFIEFYQWQRERFNILIDDNYRPFGGRWSFDTDNRKKLPADVSVPGIASFGDNQYVQEALQYVDTRFAANPGSIGSFIWPTNHAEAKRWLYDFFEQRFNQFGQYEDAIDSKAVWLFHSVLSPMLNIGLLNAREVIEEALAYAATTKKQVPLESLEGFVRQVIGWREYVRGLYITQGRKMRLKNALGNKRHLTRDWYEGTTGLPPVDDVIHKVKTHAYAHHIERLMVMGNIMLLSDIHPDEVYKWFMTFFIDAYDWVMVPNVYGMSQYADGGTMTTKPYMSASNYILQMSNYKRDTWCDIWDGLFWRFVDQRRIMLKRNPRLGGVLIKRYDTMDPPRKRIIGYRAQDFLDSYTLNA